MSTIYLDAETTGLDGKAEIVQLAMLDKTGNVLLDTLVQCQDGIPEAATAIHGISNAMLADAPRWPDIHEQVVAILRRADTIKIYNAPFDLRLLCQTAERYGLSTPKLFARCVMREYANQYFEGNWVKLTEACAYEGIDVSDLTAHNALADCEMTRRLDIEMQKELDRRQRRTQQRQQFTAQKLAMLPDDISTYPDFGMGGRPDGYKTMSELRKRDLSQFEFAGTCCDTYGNKGYVFKPKAAAQ